ncbi:MAG: DNA repair protein RecN [Muribaculaceae bacterium]|nr:DNA repair protein RecN [Muribaculaceae bacterium]
MLEKLSIDNYALIDRSSIDFCDGFTTITGETGAGKSIMLDALSLLMGARADSKAMRDKNRKMVVEGIFSNPMASIKNICEENDIEWDAKELILRREISTSGKSRGFVNDTPVNLSLLASVADGLLDIHSQHSNSLLNDPHEQLSIIDSFGGNNEILEAYRVVFHNYVSLRNKIKRIKESIAKGKENKDFIIFRLEQLDKLKPKKGELISLEREAELLGDADKIKSDLSEAQDLIGGGISSALKCLQGASSVMEGIDFELLDAKGDNDLVERLNTIKIELRDIADTLGGFADKIDSDPGRLEKVQARIDSLYEAMKKFKVKDEDELVELHQQLKEELSSISGDKTDVVKFEHQLKELAKDLKEKADLLTESRIKVSERFSESLMEKIIPLGLPNVKFQIDIQKGKMTAEGQDIVTFFCSFNKNHPLQPISEIASGGEIARVMLGIKSIMAENMNLPTIIFDEVDTGVSGEIAHRMGNMMHGMSKSIQVIAVTHLPQVAAVGDKQLKVYKDDDDEKTVSHIKLLNPEERITEIAAMISGTSINNAALENAKILLQTNKH